MSTLGALITKLRTEQGWNQSELADRLGVSQATVSRWETGQAINPPERKQIAATFGIPFLDFEAQWREVNMPRRRTVPGIPVINRAPAGLVVNYEETMCDSQDGFEYLDFGDVNDDLAFAVIVVGDSMEPDLRDGDKVVFTPIKGVPKPRASLDEGKTVFVRFTPESRRDGCTIASWHQEKDGTIMLTKSNRKYKPIICQPIEIEQLSVAFELRRKV